MEEYQKRFKVIKEYWKQLRETCEEAPVHFESYVTDVSLEDIDWMIDVLGQWFDRKRALEGTRPILNVVKAILVTSLERVTASASTLLSGTFGENQWRAFLINLGHLFNAIQSAALFEEGKNGDKGDAHALYTALLESHVEVQRVIEQARGFSADVEGYQATFEAASSQAGEIESLLDESKASLEAISKNEEKAVGSNSRIAGIEEAFEDQAKLMDKLLEENEQLKSDLQANRELMNEQLNEVESIQENCNKLLKSATTAGLTLAFADRADKVKVGKWIWSIGFVVSIIGLVIVALAMIPDIKNAMAENENIWSPVLLRLPLTLPVIWLAWFCAVQYGNSLRLQEDYEFKASTCKAFEGFHKHFEVLEKYPAGEATNALKTLAQNTIKTLAQEPGRKLGKCEKDVSFWTAFFNSRREGRRCITPVVDED